VRHHDGGGGFYDGCHFCPCEFCACLLCDDSSQANLQAAPRAQQAPAKKSHSTLPDFYAESQEAGEELARYFPLLPLPPLPPPPHRVLYEEEKAFYRQLAK
jgi:hypothetical protein